MDVNAIIMLVATVVIIACTIIAYGKYKGTTTNFNPVRFMARVAIFGAMSTILYVVPIFSIKLPFFPSFLSLHFDEIPAFICGYAYGPLAAFCVIAIKTIIKLPFTSTMLVGEFCDLFLSCLFVIPTAIIYKRHRTLKGALIGFGISMLIQVAGATISNVYVMIPFYMNLMGFPEVALLSMMQKAIPAITDVGWSYGLLCVVPFNLLKDAIVFVFVFMLYRSLHTFLRMEKKSK